MIDGAPVDGRSTDTVLARTADDLFRAIKRGAAKDGVITLTCFEQESPEEYSTVEGDDIGAGGSIDVSGMDDRAVHHIQGVIARLRPDPQIAINRAGLDQDRIVPPASANPQA